jgi:hypothetical protein
MVSMGVSGPIGAARAACRVVGTLARIISHTVVSTSANMSHSVRG